MRWRTIRNFIHIFRRCRCTRFSSSFSFLSFRALFFFFRLFYLPLSLISTLVCRKSRERACFILCSLHNTLNSLFIHVRVHQNRFGQNGKINIQIFFQSSLFCPLKLPFFHSQWQNGHNQSQKQQQVRGGRYTRKK